MAEKKIVPVAHDFICPWCWIGYLQAREMQDEFGVQIEWLGYELYPDELEWPEPSASAPDVQTNRPKTPTRMALAWAAQGMEAPTVARPKNMRTHNAHEAVEYAKTEGVADELLEKLYRALWEEGKEINNPDVLADLAHGTIRDTEAFMAAIRERKFKDKIVGFDDPAYANGVYNVPTFYINGERYAEQPYSVLRKSLREWLGV